jgi:hypothetical protein
MLDSRSTHGSAAVWRTAHAGDLLLVRILRQLHDGESRKQAVLRTHLVVVQEFFAGPNRSQCTNHDARLALDHKVTTHTIRLHVSA